MAAEGPEVGLYYYPWDYFWLNPGYTHIWNCNPSTIRGVIRKASSPLNATGQLKYKIFYPDSTYFRFISESAYVPIGPNSDVYLPVEHGCYIGVYIYSGKVMAGPGGYQYFNHVGDVISDTPKGDWYVDEGFFMGVGGIPYSRGLIL